MALPPSRYRLLVVDDDPDHVFLVHAVFAHLDHRASIETTQTAEEAVAYLGDCRRASEKGPGDAPDVIVLDLNMPGMGGLGFLEWHADSEWADIPVVVFSTDGSAGTVRKCFSLGARDFKEKGIDFGELVPVVQRVLERWAPEAASEAG